MYRQIWKNNKHGVQLALQYQGNKCTYSNHCDEII